MKALKITSKVISFLLLFVLVLSATLAISSKLSGGTPKFFGKTMMLVLSGSMEPEIRTGSAIFINDVSDPSQLKQGDIITFYSPIKENTIVTHRIIDVLGSGQYLEFMTKGDNNEIADSIGVPAQNVIGVYSNLTIPYLGYIISFLQSKKGIGLALIIPGLLIIIVEIFSIWKLLTRLERPKENIALVDSSQKGSSI